MGFVKVREEHHSQQRGLSSDPLNDCLQESQPLQPILPFLLFQPCPDGFGAQPLRS